MRLLKSIVPALLAFACISSVHADSSEEINERDIEAVRNLVRSKRAMYLEEKTSNLAISGDIRFEYRHVTQRYKNAGGSWRRLRGSESSVWSGDGDSCMFFGTNEYDVEFNLYLDYTTECTWAGVHLEFDNDAGVTANCETRSEGVIEVDDGEKCGSGICDNICLREAYFGYNVFEDCDSRLDIQIGRRDMYRIFESRVQFQHRFDGAWLTYSNSFECMFDFYVTGGWFVIDSVTDNYGYIVELGLLNIADCGFDLRYSYVDYERSTDRCGERLSDGSDCVWAWNYENSQISGAYNFDSEWIGVEASVYGGFVYNHKAKPLTRSGETHRERIAWYVGFMMGSGVKQEGDWMLDINYQSVGAQSVPCAGVSGIGKGNLLGGCFPTSTSVGTLSMLYGQANYTGFAIEGAYGVTDNISVAGEVEFSDLKENWSSGSDNEYRKYAVEVIYAF